ncbi:sterile alpha motif domain-containing protein aveugle [Arctopsyche grandis]|uniref:sterile alpha motif domain-containing protein aveugle n=1 Tax=Arctopsyche grandis TaxID=121162 RepID=UPI00406D888A
MVEDTSYINNKPKSKATRPRDIHLWSVPDVMKWFRRHCTDYYAYSELFSKHDITGRALVRMNDNTLMRLGITNADHRNAIWREILKLKLKTDIMEIRDLERRNNFSAYDLQTVPV